MTFGDDGEKIEGDGTDLTISGNNINLTATADVVVPANVGITFGTGEKIEGDNTDLTVTSGGAINLTATTDVVVPANVGITFGSGEKIESDGTDLTITVGAGGDINIPANIGLTFGDDGEKIEGDGTDLTITGNNINLTATSAVDVDGALIGTRASVTNLADNGSIPITSTTVNVDADGSVRTGIRFAGAGTAGQILIVQNTGAENLTFHSAEATALLRGVAGTHDTMLPSGTYVFISDGTYWVLIGGGAATSALGLNGG